MVFDIPANYTNSRVMKYIHGEMEHERFSLVSLHNNRLAAGTARYGDRYYGHTGSKNLDEAAHEPNPNCFEAKVEVFVFLAAETARQDVRGAAHRSRVQAFRVQPLQSHHRLLPDAQVHHSPAVRIGHRQAGLGQGIREAPAARRFRGSQKRPAKFSFLAGPGGTGARPNCQ